MLSQLLPPAALNVSRLEPCASCDQCLQVEPALVDAYVSALRSRRFGLSWLYIDALDECGHAKGGKSRAYADIVQKVDAWVGQVVDALEAANMLESTALLIMSDHGREARKGYGHGGFTTSELSVQWLLVAPGVRKGAKLRAPVSIMDSAPTLLHALGISPPVQTYGRVVREAYEPLAHPPDGGSSFTPAAGTLWSLTQDPTTGYDGWSISIGLLAGAALGVGGYVLTLRVLKWREDAKKRARVLSDAYSANVHPAARRLGAAAGTTYSSEDDEFGPLTH